MSLAKVKGKGMTMKVTTTLRALAMLVAASVCGALLAVPAQAAPPPGSKFEITSFITEVKNAAGADETQAAAHPVSARAEFKLSTYEGSTTRGTPPGHLPVEDPKTVITKLPAGFSGNPMAVGRCPLIFVPRGSFQPMQCPDETMVGFVYLDGAIRLSSPIVNVVPEKGYPAEFAFSEAGLTYTLYPELRSDGDYGLNMVVPAANNDAITRVDVTFCSYGVEANFVIMSGDSTFRCRLPGEPKAMAKPFLTNPASLCPSVAPVTDLLIDSWQSPGEFATAQAVSPLITGCDRLTFDPAVAVKPTTSAPDAPAGLDVDMTFPTADNVEGLAPPALKKAVVTLPDGMTINPSAANGLQACADAELKLKSKVPVTCPEASKVGTVTAKSPLMEEELTGGVYIRSQNSGDPESGEMFRLALVLENEERGISVRLPGSIVADKNTGRLVTTFDNNPELPVSDINVTFKDGPRAPLATPPTCGTKTVNVQLTSWGGQTVDRTSDFTVDCTAGLGGFAPAFSAGTNDPTGGAFSPFTLNITKPDRDTALDNVSLKMPTGLLAKIKDNLNTQVGTVRTYAGPGSQPFMLPGTVTLEGPYGDAPYSLRVVVPAKAGPFDLGEVVVRQKVYVDPVTAQVSVVSDPLPTVVKGVPVRLQRLEVLVDKPGFMVNPTSCAPKTVDGVLGSAAGQSAAVSVRFQAGGCADLKFDPQLAMRVGVKRSGGTFVAAKTPAEMRDGGHPALSARVAMGPGRANNRRATVTLPKSMALDPDNANGLCEPVDAARDTCPAASIVGNVTAVTPLIGGTADGPVYFVRGERTDPKSGRIIKTLPKLFVPLRSSENPKLKIELRASSDVDGDDRLVTTFDNLPDVAISTFDLNINGGKNGILVVSNTDVCSATQYADSAFVGQSDKRYDGKIGLDTACPLGVVKSSHSAGALKLTLGGLAPGKVTVSGKGVTKKSKSIRAIGPKTVDQSRSGTEVTVSATTHTSVALPLSKANRRALARGRDVKVKVTVAFKAQGATKTTKTTKTVTIHGAKKKSKK
jgi:hypothetical protein